MEGGDLNDDRRRCRRDGVDFPGRRREKEEKRMHPRMAKAKVCIQPIVVMFVKILRMPRSCRGHL